jgi:hypothetical protein
VQRAVLAGDYVPVSLASDFKPMSTKWCR